MTAYRYLHVLATEPDFSFWVDGVPAPQGSKKHVGRGVLVESSKKLKPWRRSVEIAARQCKPPGMLPMDGPLFCTVTFWLPRPKGYPKTQVRLPQGPPDIDKLARGALDPLTQNGIIHDDARIIDLLTCKRFVPTDERHTVEGDMTRTGARFELWYLQDVTPYTSD